MKSLWTRISLRMKLLISICGLLSLVLVVAFISFTSMKHSDVALAEARRINISFQRLNHISLQRLEINISAWSSLVEYNPEAPTKGSGLKSLETASHEFEAGIDRYEADTKFDDKLKENLTNIRKSWSEFRAESEKYGTSLMSPGLDRAKVKALAQSLEDKSLIISDLLSEGRDLLDKESAKIEEESHATAKTDQIYLMVSFACGLFLAFLSVFVTIFVTKQIAKICSNLNELGGDVGNVAESISSSSQDLSSSVTQQSAALQETASAIEETSATISKNADNARQSTQLSEHAQEAVSQGKHSVDEVVGSIEEISKSNVEIMNQIEESNREISAIVKVIAEIGNKTKVINDIVFQTKLLSFNASVEAARAGEHGKGFAVVAQEIGNLAQMSGNSAKEITEMLDGSIKKVEEIVSTTNSRLAVLVQSAKTKVQTGTVTAKRSGEILDKIVKNVMDVGSMVSEISTASQQQAQGIQEINKAMTELDSVAQQNNLASQKSSVTATELRGQVDRLNDVVTVLTALVFGSKGGQSKPGSPHADPQANFKESSPAAHSEHPDSDREAA